MSENIIVEVRFFLVSLMYGIGLIFAYDLIRIIRRIIKHNMFFIAIEDILFWTVSSFFIFAMMYKQNDGMIRGFSIAGMLIGMIAYNRILSEIIIKVIVLIIRKIFYYLCWIFKLVFKPFYIISKKINLLFRKILKPILKKNKKVRNNFVKRLKNLLKTVRMVYMKK